MSSGLVGFELRDGLGILTLDRPAAANAVTPALIADLGTAVEAAAAAPVRALLLRGAGRNFCAGADLRHFAADLDALPAELDAMAIGFHEAVARLCELPIPVVAAVQGNAIGAGFGLALAADIVLASEDARFATGYARLGLSADAGTSFFLARALGVRLARSLLISARFVPAAEALGLGLVDRCVAADALAEESLTMARALADGPTEAYAAIKRLTSAAERSELRAHLDAEREAIVALAGRPRAAEAIRRALG